MITYRNWTQSEMEALDNSTMIKKFTDESLDDLFVEMSGHGIAALPDGRYALFFDTTQQLPDNAIIEPAKNPMPHLDFTHLGIYRQFHIFVTPVTNFRPVPAYGWMP